MLDYVKQLLTSQYDAALSMLGECVRQCPESQWQQIIGKESFRWVAYHALFFADLYLSESEHKFELRDLHRRGGDERLPVVSIGLSKQETLTYVPVCREKMLESISQETAASLAGPSGFSWYDVDRGQMHLINIRHIQHHTGQLSAFLRRMDDALQDRNALRWVGSG